MPSGYNALAARPQNKLAYPGQDVVQAFTQGLGPMLYGAAKGTAASIAGLPGDIEQLARQLLLSGAAPDSYTAKNMAAQALLPTSDRVKAMLPSLSSFGAGPQAQYTENMAANLGQNIVGNLVAPKALPGAIRATEGLPVGASVKPIGVIDTAVYQGSHKAPNAAVYGGTLDDLSKIMPADVYSSKGINLYGLGDPKVDAEWFKAAYQAKNNPDKLITIYRAVPKGVKDINNGDWVTTSQTYAKMHGENTLNGDYKILSNQVPAKTLSSEGYPYEFGYNAPTK